MTNIVIDTNVLVHSCNPNNAYFGRAVDLVSEVKESSCNICVDEGLDAGEAQNQSLIWAEYTRHVPQASLAMELLSHLLINARVGEFKKQVPQQVHSEIRRRVTDTTDVVFVKVAYNSESDYLVSHDFAAFPTHVRDELEVSNISSIVDCYGVTFQGS